MSGPIVRKYGFPNFEKIFGPKAVQHGVDDQPEADQPAAQDPDRALRAGESREEPAGQQRPGGTGAPGR